MRPERQSLVVICVLLVLAALFGVLCMTSLYANWPSNLSSDTFRGGTPRLYFEWSSLCAVGAGGVFLWSAHRDRTGQPK